MDLLMQKNIMYGEVIIQQIVLYSIFSIGFYLILIFLLNFFDQFFSYLFFNMSKDDSIEKLSLKKQINFLKNLKWKKNQHIKSIEESYQKREVLFYNEINKLVEKNQNNEKEITILKSEKLLDKKVLITEKNDRKNGQYNVLNGLVDEIYDNVFCTSMEDEQEMYRNCIEEFDLFIQREKIRCALPYKVILRLYDLYDEIEMQKFALSFKEFHECFNVLEMKQIFQSSFLSPEQKLKQLIEKDFLNANDDEFVKFVFYMLTNFSYRQVNGLYGNFIRVYDIYFYTGIIKIELSSKESKEIFSKEWVPAHSNYQTEFLINPRIIGGAVIYYGNMSIDMSYKELMQRYVMKKEVSN